MEARPVSSVHSSQCRQVSRPPPPPKNKNKKKKPHKTGCLSFLVWFLDVLLKSRCGSMWFFIANLCRAHKRVSTGERMYVYGIWFNVSSLHWYISLSIFQLVNNAMEIDAPTNETIYNGCSSPHKKVSYFLPHKTLNLSSLSGHISSTPPLATDVCGMTSKGCQRQLLVLD